MHHCRSRDWLLTIRDDTHHRENIWQRIARRTARWSNRHVVRRRRDARHVRATHPVIVPVIVGETAQAIRMSDMLLEEGVFVTGFGYPVVPQGQARLRCQVSAAHTRDDLDRALDAFVRVGSRLQVV